MTSFGLDAFAGCTGLTKITVGKDNPRYDSREDCNAIIVTETDKLVIGCEKTKIPESVKSIGKRAFQNCAGLLDVEIPKNVITIGENAFSGCNGLENVIVPEGVTVIENGVFSGCSRLISIVLPDSLTSIGKDVFLDCDSLSNVFVEKDSKADTWAKENQYPVKYYQTSFANDNFEY